MKKLVSLIILSMCSNLFAQQRVELNSSEVEVNEAEALVVRTAQTPNIVKMSFKVPFSRSVCETYATRMITVTSAARCGTTRVITGYTTRTVCVQRNPKTGQCMRTETQRIPIFSNFPRTCTVPETYCASYRTVTSYETDSVKIKFKNLPALGGTEEDTFSIKARQRSYNGINVVYDISPVQTVTPYAVKSRGILGIDCFVIKVKK
jgi:hypothetical protein